MTGWEVLFLLRRIANGENTNNRHSRRYCSSFPPSAGMMNNVAKRKKSPGAIFRERSEPEGRVSGMIRANSVKTCVRRSRTQHAAKPRYRFHSTIIFTTYSILPIYRACRDARRRVETGAPIRKGGCGGHPFSLAYFPLCFVVVRRSLGHALNVRSLLHAFHASPTEKYTALTHIARTRATDSSHTSHKLLGGEKIAGSDFS